MYSLLMYKTFAEHSCNTHMKRKRSLSGCLALPGIKALSHEGDEFDNVRLHKRYLSEVISRRMRVRPVYALVKPLNAACPGYGKRHEKAEHGLERPPRAGVTRQQQFALRG